MNMQQDTAPESYQYDPTEVKPKAKSGKLMTILLLYFLSAFFACNNFVI